MLPEEHRRRQDAQAKEEKALQIERPGVQMSAIAFNRRTAPSLLFYSDASCNVWLEGCSANKNSLRVEHRPHVDRETRQQFRRSRLPASISARLFIGVTARNGAR